MKKSPLFSKETSHSKDFERHLTTILFIFFILTSYSQALYSQSIPEIPLEAFDGFKQDSFSLPGNNVALPVYKYGQYKSTITTKLDGVGNVYVHHVLYFQEDEYSFMEIYSREPSSKFIEGIKRYGNFRMYVHQNFGNEVNYTGKPKVEIVRGLNSIITTIHPLSIFRLSEGKEMDIGGESNDDNHLQCTVVDCKKYVDPILLDSLYDHPDIDNCSFSGWIQYDLEMDLIKIDLYFGMYGDPGLGTFESVIYDSLGQMVGHIDGYGPLSYVNLTANQRYVYTNTGGAVTEDFIAPYVFRIYDLKSNKIIFSRRSTTFELVGFAIANSNLGVYRINKEFGGIDSGVESYIIDHDKGILYILHMNPLCQQLMSTTFYPTYCDCYTRDGLKSKIFYEKDLISIKFNPD